MRASFDGRDLHVDEEAQTLMTSPEVKNHPATFEAVMQALLGFTEYERCKATIKHYAPPFVLQPTSPAAWLFGVRVYVDLDTVAS